MMAITPIDIYNKEFDKTRKGYNAEQVDVFLDEIVESFENLHKLNISLKEKNEVLVEKLNNYRSIETALNKTLNTAEITSKDIIDNAQNKADLLIQEAEIKAKKIVQDAEERANYAVRESDEKNIKAKRELEEIKRQVSIYKNRMVAVLQAQLKAVASDYEMILDDDGQLTNQPNQSSQESTGISLQTEMDLSDDEEIVPELQQEEPDDLSFDDETMNEAVDELINEVDDESMIEVVDEVIVDQTPEIPQPSLAIDQDYFNFQEDDADTTNEFVLPQDKQLDGTFFGIEEVPEEKETQGDDYIQIDYATPENLKIEQEEVQSTPKDKEQGYSLEDAFLELRRAAEIYKDSRQDNQRS